MSKADKMTNTEWVVAGVLAVFLIVGAFGAAQVILSAFPTQMQMTAKPPGAGGDSDGEVVKLDQKFHPVSLYFWTLGTPRPIVGQLLLALAAGALGGFLHAIQSLAAFAGARRFRARWTIWYILRAPTGGLLGLLLFAGIRAGLVTADGDVVSPHGIFVVGSLSGLFAKRSLDKLREMFCSLIGDREAAAKPVEPDRLTDQAALATISSVDPKVVKSVAAQPGPIDLVFETSRDVDEVTHVRIDATDFPIKRTDPCKYKATLDDQQRGTLAQRLATVYLVGTPEKLPLTEPTPLRFE